MNYRDLNIHQRINAKGNKVSFSPKIEGMRPGLILRISQSIVDMSYYVPGLPLYAIQIKTNNFDLPAKYNPHA